MSNESEDTSLLFGVIPSFLRTPEQVARWYELGELPTYTLLRTPVGLNELNKYKHAIAIWRDNDTLTYVSPSGCHYHPKIHKGSLCLRYIGRGPVLHIFGKTDNAIAETAAFFLKLEDPTEKSDGLHVDSFSGTFDFRAAGSQCLTKMVEAAPSLHLSFRDMTMSADQSIVLATRSHPTELNLSSSCTFEDGGTAFVDALQARQSSIGSITFDWSTPLDDDNMKRLLQQVDTIERLTLTSLKDDIALLPFTAQVDSIDFRISSSLLQEVDLQSLNIVANKLAVVIRIGESGTFPTELILSFWRRVADLGHFMELKVTPYEGDIPDCVVHQLIVAAFANPMLQVLDLTNHEYVNLNAHVETLFKVLQDHKELRTLKLDAGYDEDGYLYDREPFGPNFSYLRQLLSHNRNITVTNFHGRIYTDGSSIDELYSLNSFYRGSANLIRHTPAERPSLVMTALVERASNDFQRSALLLSNHVDVLCELVQFAKLDELSEDSSRSSLERSTRKRKGRIQPPRAAKAPSK